ncbi:MAG: MBL fold metallo-hydrolase [Spirochaetales bacterium]|nr:MBL fold metallo-hydrolase [Spirochaetales bacterium]
MKKLLLILIGTLGLSLFSCEQAAKPMDVSALIKNIEWLQSSSAFGSPCIRIMDEKVIYIDPAALTITDATPKADLILITHSHNDHFSVANVKQLLKEETQIVTIIDCQDVLETRLPDENWHIQVVAAGEKLNAAGMEITAFPAYNTDESAPHTKQSGFVGFVFNYRGVRLYVSGDTSFIPEMKELKNIDIAFCNIRSFYCMSGEEAVQAVQTFGPKYLIPVHWLKTEQADIDYIKANCPDSTEVLFPTPVMP